MALQNKPDLTEVWASGGASVKPSDEKIQLGWVAEVPPFQYENWVQNRQDQMLAHINQRGIPVWDGLTEYEAGGLSYAQGSNGVVYKSVAASGPATTVQDPTTDAESTYWEAAFADSSDTRIVNAVQTSGNQTIAGVKTFSSFPVTPSAAPAADYQAANKKYVDDVANSQPSMTGLITLNGTTDNTVVMSGIVTELDLEIGDVIRIETGAYNKLHTVESITDNSSIIVNYEHAGNRGDGSLKLPDFTGQATVTRIAKWFNAPLGLGQAWVNVTPVRVFGSNYTNNTNRALVISVTGRDNTDGGNYSVYVHVDGLEVARARNMASHSSARGQLSVLAPVPLDAIYVANTNQQDSLNVWAELR